MATNHLRKGQHSTFKETKRAKQRRVARTWKRSEARLTLTFPKNLPETTVLDIARRVRDSVRQDLQVDGQEVFGKDAPKVQRSIHFTFSNR